MSKLKELEKDKAEARRIQKQKKGELEALEAEVQEERNKLNRQQQSLEQRRSQMRPHRARGEPLPQPRDHQ